MHTPHLAVINGQINLIALTPVHQRAMCFVSARIADADASQWHGGYIHGLIQAFLMTGMITVKQGCKLEDEQERASYNALTRRAIENVPRRAVGGVV